jgi:hypothetical protein
MVGTTANATLIKFQPFRNKNCQWLPYLFPNQDEMKYFCRGLKYSIPCCDVRYDFHIKTMFCSSLPLVVCRRVHVLFTLFVFAHSGVQHILCCIFALFVFGLVSCCQFLWIVHFWLPLRYSLTFIVVTNKSFGFGFSH